MNHANAADWSIAPPQLKTRWTKDVSPTNARPEYPRPQMVRKDWLNLNGVWDCGLGKEQKFESKILVPFPIESALSGIQKHDDHVWYRRTFPIPASWGDKRILLHFGAVDWETTITVNGKPVGTHRGGYDPFSFDITDAIKRDGDNEIIVHAFDPTDKGGQAIGKQRLKPEGIWYTPVTGIWQTVWMEPVNANYIHSLKIVADLDGGSVVVTADVPGSLASDTIEIVVKDGERPVVRAKPQVAEQRRTSADNSVTARLAVGDSKSWSPENPFLYNLTVTITRDGKLLDRVDSYFGMRKIEVTSDGQFQRIFLNNKPITQTGPLDQGFWPDGIYTAPTHEAMIYDLEMTKKLGFNMIRKHVKVEPATWYEWCDRNGMLVWQDMPSMFPSKEQSADPEVKEQFETELKSLVESHRNSPSIITWVVFNEGWGQYDTERLTKWVKELDPTRLTINASGWTDKNCGDIVDLHKYPGPGAPKAEMQRATVLGEFGGLGLDLPEHSWRQNRFSYRQTSDSEQLTKQYVHLFGLMWALTEDEGLCAAVYTQTTDVEGEINGLMTYDREVLKVNLERAAAANSGKTPRLRYVPVMPSAESTSIDWRYTLEKPADDWNKAGFDDSKWQSGKAGFGKKGTPASIVNTDWTSPDIWMRREFDLPAGATDGLLLRLHHDDAASVYINGALATTADGAVHGYGDHPIAPEALATLKPGKNTIAVTCHQTGGGQYIDAGIVRLIAK